VTHCLAYPPTSLWVHSDIGSLHDGWDRRTPFLQRCCTGAPRHTKCVCCTKAWGGVRWEGRTDVDALLGTILLRESLFATALARILVLSFWNYSLKKLVRHEVQPVGLVWLGASSTTVTGLDPSNVEFQPQLFVRTAFGPNGSRLKFPEASFGSSHIAHRSTRGPITASTFQVQMPMPLGGKFIISSISTSLSQWPPP
jgi:hypothetical protein